MRGYRSFAYSAVLSAAGNSTHNSGWLKVWTDAPQPPGKVRATRLCISWCCGRVFTSSWLEVSLPSHLGLFLSILLFMLLHYTRQWLQVRKIAVLRCAFRSDAEEIQY